MYILITIFPTDVPAAMPYSLENGTSRRTVGTQPLHKLTKPLFVICVCSTFVNSVGATKIGEYTVMKLQFKSPFPSHFHSFMFFHQLSQAIHLLYLSQLLWQLTAVRNTGSLHLSANQLKGRDDCDGPNPSQAASQSTGQRGGCCVTPKVGGEMTVEDCAQLLICSEVDDSVRDCYN